MALKLKGNTFFLHLPKTGGVSISSFLDKKKLVLENIVKGEKGNAVAGLSKTVHRFPDEEYYNKDSKFFIFIRNPLTWYKSLFIFKYQTGKINKHPKENLINQSYKDINAYINDLYNYCKNNKTSGLLTEYFNIFNKENVRVLHFENFNDGVKKILQSCAPANFENHYDDFLKHPKRNRMKNPKGAVQRRFNGITNLNEDSVEKIKEIDYPIMSQFYHEEL